MSSPTTPDERVPMPVPVGRRLLDRTTDFLPSLEPATFQRQRLEHLPPGFDQIQIGRVLGLEDELPAGISQAKEQHIRGAMGLQIIHDRVHPRHFRREPSLDLLEEVGPVGGRPAAVGTGEGFAGGGPEGAEDVPLATTAVIDLLVRPLRRRGWPCGFRLGLGMDELLAWETLGTGGSHFVEADDDRVLGRLGIKFVDEPLFFAKLGSTRSPNQVS